MLKRGMLRALSYSRYFVVLLVCYLKFGNGFVIPFGTFKNVFEKQRVPNVPELRQHRMMSYRSDWYEDDPYRSDLEADEEETFERIREKYAKLKAYHEKLGDENLR